MLADKAQVHASKGTAKYIAFNLGLHIYLLMTLQRSFGLSLSSILEILPLMVAGASLPVFVHVQLKQRGPSTALRWGAWIGYTWLGSLLLFLSFGIAMDFLGVVLGTSRMVIASSLDMRSMNRPEVFFLDALVAAGIAVYGVFEAKRIRIKRLVIRTGKPLGPSGKIRIVQISDTHFGLLVDRKRAMDIADAVKVANPDVFVSTGDFIDANVSHVQGIDDVFRGITPRYGKYAILGNHEVAVGAEKCIRFLNEAGFRVLRNERVVIDVPVALSGMDDESVLQGGDSDPQVLHLPLPDDVFSVLLRHRPLLYDTGKSCRPDLQLSGHTHAGQIFPFRGITTFFFPYAGGLYDVPGGGTLYVNSGTGTWGPPMRFLTPPEVTVVDVENVAMAPSSRRKSRRRPKNVSIREVA